VVVLEQQATGRVVHVVERTRGLGGDMAGEVMQRFELAGT
jgi:predicted NAD/FAD-dependent oxidoreductase